MAAQSTTKKEEKNEQIFQSKKKRPAPAVSGRRPITALGTARSVGGAKRPRPTQGVTSELRATDLFRTGLIVDRNGCFTCHLVRSSVLEHFNFAVCSSRTLTICLFQCVPALVFWSKH
jgi:hypothetical protein